ncbi:OFA family oxalate/formate antiporter-like MFS transporter [Anaerobacterium chartisolvens]|uniref:OFA family oxalate/formate antiporter-like MFS transporter n=1 Tax=Anaerobacterium chartisolvens TaxID=1297424 RepID=A0A369ATA9_9FIRM|nr:MFS transporter [Anaerobacterium chartisolvens]RCX12315.1 OFA family oxalate/formate antiporter-like MFS transporter [Anaerobacterium chartisolvens]
MPGIAQNKQGLKVLIAGSVLQLFLGIVYVWSVFVMPVSQFYGWDVSSVKLTTSYMLSFFVVGILIGGNLQVKIGSTRSVLLGGLLLSAGMFATAFIPQAYAWLVYVTYGIIGGFGVGVGYITVISAAQKWFPKNRGFATGISVCAFGFSTVVFAPLIETLIKQYGLQNTFLILSVGFFIVVLALFSFIKMPDESVTGNAASTALLSKRQYTVTEILKTKEFYFITLSLMLATAAFFILNPSFKTFAIERGLDPAMGTVVVMLTGVANALGRLGVPFLSDKIGREKAALSIIVATGLCALLLCFVQGFIFIATIVVIAFCYGGYSGIYPVITADYFGIKNVGSNYGAVMVGFAISALVFPMILNHVGDVTAKFIILASFAVVGAILVILLMRSNKKQ